MTEALRDAIRYWELRRVPYNLLLAALVGAWVMVTWPVFRPAVVLPHLAELVALALIANFLYCAAYVVELAFHQSAAWERWRWVLWLVGTALALLLTQYWVGDEIFPDAVRQLH